MSQITHLPELQDSLHSHFATTLRVLRQLKGFTQLETAKGIFVARETYTGWENQRSLPDDENCTALDAFFGTSPLIKDLREHCNREHIASWFEPFIGHEATSVEIRTYQSMLIPGLLQTEGYMRVINDPGYGQADEDGIARRLERAKVLTREEDPPHLFAVIDEGALVRPLRNREVMREQLLHLLKMSRLPNVHIQVARMDAGWHWGLYGPMVIFTAPDLSRVGYVETQIGGRLIQDKRECWGMSLRFDVIRGVALPEDESRDFIRQIMETMQDDRVA